MKHILTFESFKETEKINTIYKQWVNENIDSQHLFERQIFEDETEEEKVPELTSGEKAALARDAQILSKPQLAALYLRALGAIDENVDKYMPLIIYANEDNDTKIPNILDFADDKKHWTSAAFADAIGLNSDYTVSRTVGKFKNMLSGVGHSEQDVLYPKVIKAFDEFHNMDVHMVGQLAGECLQSSENSTVRDLVAKRNDELSSKRSEKTETMDNVFRLVYELEHKLAKAFPSKSKAQISTWAVEKVAKEKSINPIKITSGYDKFKKKFDLK